MSWTKTNKVRVKHNIPTSKTSWWAKGTETDVENFPADEAFSDVLEDLYEHSSCEGTYKAFGNTVYRVLYKDVWFVKSVVFTEDHLDPTKEVFPTVELANARCREIIDSKRVLNTSSAINNYLNTIDVLSSKDVSKTPFGELARDMDAIKACVKDLKRLLQ